MLIALQEIATAAETLAQELARGGQVKQLCRSATKLPIRLLIPVNYFRTCIHKVNQRNSRTGAPFLVILQLAFERLIESHMRSLQRLVAIGEGQIVNLHYV